MSLPPSRLEQILETQIQTLALTLRPSTITHYRSVARGFLGYLQVAFRQLRRLSQLRRDPHLLGWFRWRCERQPPVRNETRAQSLAYLRRLLDDLAALGHPLQPELIRRDDFPPQAHYLPRPLPPEDDPRLQPQLRRTDDLPAHALLLTRATGIRIGECVDLPLDCLRQLAADQWALPVPLGKLHTEHLVPADAEVRRLVARLLALRALAPPARWAPSEGWLLPRSTRRTLCKTLRAALAEAAQRVGCSGSVTPHRLRHSFATEMLRLGASLPALMQLLGHKDIRMTMRYVEVTPQDLHREFHTALQHAASPHRVPVLPVPHTTTTTTDLTPSRVVKIFKCVEGSRSSMMDVEDEHNHMRAAFGLRDRFGKPATPARE